MKAIALILAFVVIFSAIAGYIFLNPDGLEIITRTDTDDDGVHGGSRLLHHDGHQRQLASTPVRDPQSRSHSARDDKRNESAANRAAERSPGPHGRGAQSAAAFRHHPVGQRPRPRPPAEKGGKVSGRRHRARASADCFYDRPVDRGTERHRQIAGTSTE